MAKVQINGTISVSEMYPRLVTLWEQYDYEYKGEPKQGKRKWSVWFITDAHGLATGDWVELNGSLSTKAVEWNTPGGDVKNLVDHIVNNPELINHKPKAPAEKPRDLDDEAKYGGMPF